MSLNYEYKPDPNFSRHLQSQGWIWYETNGMLDFSTFNNKPTSAIFGAWFRENLVVDIGFENGSVYMKAKDPNTREPIEIEYGIHMIYPILAYKTRGGDVATFKWGVSIDGGWDLLIDTNDLDPNVNLIEN